MFFNLPARDLDNAREIIEASEGFAVISVALSDYASIEEAYEAASDLIAVAGMVSLGAGRDGPSLWQSVVELALRVNPGHVSQVFPAAGYTVGALHARGLEGNVVNALVSLDGASGQVLVSTGPLSELGPEQALVQCRVAFRMIREVGASSVRVGPIDGDKRLDDVRTVAREAREAGLQLVEPAGGISVDNVAAVLTACLFDGPELAMPHLHGSVLDAESGRTDPAKVAGLVREAKRCLGIA